MKFKGTDRNVGIVLAVILCASFAFGAFSPLTTGVAHASTASSSPAAPLSAPVRGLAPLEHPAPAAFHYGDLTIGPANSPYVISPSTNGGSSQYYQQGNVTVLPGGVLDVENISFDMVQYIGSSGTVSERVANLFNFSVEGIVYFNGSILTTDVNVLDAYAKLTLNISNGGSVVANDSQLLFPGWILVSGPASHLYANSTTIGPNPAIPSLSEDATLRADTSFGPSLIATDEATVDLFGSRWTGTYGNNESSYAAGVGLQNLSNVDVASGAGHNWTAFQFAINPVPEALAEALGYNSMSAGNLSIGYKVAANVTAPTGNALWIGTKSYPLGPISFPDKAQSLTIPLPADYIAAIDSIGVRTFLQDSGEFGTSSQLNLSLGVVDGGTNVTGVNISLTPSFPYNQVVVDSTFTAADSFLSLNWNATPSENITSSTAWGSHKLILSGGATAYLANDSVSGGFDTVFENQSVIIPTDAASNAYFYRWAEFNVTSPAFGPIPGVRVSVFSGDSEPDSANATTTEYNDLSAVDPDLATYDQRVTAADGGGTNVSNNAGSVSLLLLSSTLSWVDLPDGEFVGTYHVATVIPGLGSGASKWFSASLTPYPQGMSPSEPNTFPTVPYTNYEAQLTIPAVNLAVNGVTISNATVAIGQQLNLSASIE
ncbi:MAG: hypothetical protein L3K03_09430, partial [Thermoplasmata archaeon]|nr:hypothetical protein [Thermoplasmata archaeon]